MARTRVVLVSAFEPFGGRKVNRSIDAARALAAAPPAGVTVAVELLPVAFDQLEGAVTRLVARAKSLGAAGVLMLGESSSARGLRVERLAVNLIDARIDDNAGRKPQDVPVDRRGPAARFATAPVKALALAASRAGTTTDLSLSAGVFACNAAYYLTLRDAPASLPVCFVHLPTSSRALSAAALGKGVAAVATALASKAGATSPRGR